MLSGDEATCRPRDAQENQPCQEDYGGPVQQFPGCDASKGLTCLQGTCRKLPQVGQPCGDVGGGEASSTFLEECLGGYCSFESDALPVCKPFLPDGASCQEDAQCLWPSRCTGNTCKVLSFAELCGGSGTGGSGGAGGSGGSAGTGGGETCKECAQEKCSEPYETCLQSPPCNAAQPCILEKCEGVNDLDALFACAASACGISEVIPEGLVNLAYCLLDHCSAGECMNLGSGGMGGGSGGGTLCVPEVCDGVDNDCDELVDEGFDLINDPLNCGACNNACSPGQVCSEGHCVWICEPGLTKCNGVCVNLLSDNQHCGACNNACSPEHGCTKGVCSGAQ